MPDQLLTALAGLENLLAGYQISRLQHSLQSATRVETNGADTELIIGALFHDLGDGLAPLNNSQPSAAIIRPYVRAEVDWIIEHHGVFRCITLVMQRELTKMPERFTTIISGLIVVPIFAANRTKGLRPCLSNKAIVLFCTDAAQNF